MEDLITEPYLTNKVVVITGAAGFIGSHLVDKCLDLRAIVIGVDNFITGRRINLAHLQEQERFFLVEADVSTPTEQYLGPALEQVQTILPEVQAIEVVFTWPHPLPTRLPKSANWDLFGQFTWYPPITDIFAKPVSCRAFGFASSSKVYGEPWCIRKVKIIGAMSILMVCARVMAKASAWVKRFVGCLPASTN